jgi:hypothetical protein
VPRVPLDGALHLAAFRPALLVARLARLLRGTRPLPDRRCNKISGHAGEADEHHGVDHIEQGYSRCDLARHIGGDARGGPADPRQLMLPELPAETELRY